MADTFVIVPAQNLSVLPTHLSVTSTLRLEDVGSSPFFVFPCSYTSWLVIDDEIYLI